jgi:predicted nucleic acid-binding protein
MIVVDANVIVRLLIGPQSATDEPLCAAAAALFRAVAAGRQDVTTNEAVVAEVVFVLHNRRQYDVPRPEVAERFRVVLDLPRFRLPNKHVVIAALDRWAATPSLSFVDVLTTLQAEEAGTMLATFDAAMARHAGVPLWRPDPA